MNPIDFSGRNVIFAEDQPEYRPLPAIKMPGTDGEVISCWQFTDEEIAVIVRTRCIFISQLTFNGLLQPILPMAELGDNITLL